MRVPWRTRGIPVPISRPRELEDAEGIDRAEAEVVLQLVVSCSTQTGREVGCDLAEKLLRKLEVHFRSFMRQRGETNCEAIRLFTIVEPRQRRPARPTQRCGLSQSCTFAGCRVARK